MVACARAWASDVHICMENCILEMPLSRQLGQIIGSNKFSISFESLLDFKGQSADTNDSKSGQIKPHVCTETVLWKPGFFCQRHKDKCTSVILANPKLFGNLRFCKLQAL